MTRHVILTSLLVVACGAPSPIVAPPSRTTAPTLPTVDRMVAVATESGIVVARVARHHVTVLAENLGAASGVKAFGWLDAHTLVVEHDAIDHDDQRHISVTSYRDGKEGETATLDWLARDDAELVLTANHEAWIANCSYDCSKGRFVRMVPGPRVEQHGEPAGVEPHRPSAARPWPVPPTVDGPTNVTLRIAAVTITGHPFEGWRLPDPTPKDETVTSDGVLCERDGKRVQYPLRWDTQFGVAAKATRWVSQQPPIYEVTIAVTNPADFVNETLAYFRPCDAQPLDGYAYLGDDLWASFALRSHDPPNGFGPGEPPSVDGDWTFHAGTADLGTIHGTATLRPSL